MILKSQFLAIASAVLENEKRPLSAKQIVELGFERKLFSDRLAGKTPWQTMKAKLSVHIRRNADKSPFVRTAPGRFYLQHLLEGGQAVYRARPLTPPPAHENVLVFPTSLLVRGERFQGISKQWRRYRKKIFGSGECLYLDRITAEQDNNHKQLLTYIMVTRGRRILAFRRGSYSRVADELRGSYCVGFGGHISEADNTLFSWDDFGLRNSAARELAEEVDLPDEDRRRLSRFEGLRLVGVLNDDSSPVGRRHFAFVFRYEVADRTAWDRPRRGEKSVTQLTWLDPTTPRLFLNDFEYWSQLCLREYRPDLVRAQPSFVIRRRAPLSPPHVLLVLGGLGSGKSEATRILVSEYAYREINSGRVLASLLGIPPVPKTPRPEFQREALAFIAHHDGPQQLARALIAEVVADRDRRVLIDGIRQRQTIDALRTVVPHRRVGIVFIHTPPDVAYQLYRSRTPGVSSINEFLEVRDAVVESEVGELIGISDAVVYNWLGRSMYREAIRALMRALSISPMKQTLG